MYSMMYVVLGGIYSCFGVKYSVLAVMYALTLVERKFYLLFFRCPFDVTMDPAKYLLTISSVNPIHIGIFPFYMDLNHVVFSEHYMYWCKFWIRSSLELMNWTIAAVC